MNQRHILKIFLAFLLSTVFYSITFAQQQQTPQRIIINYPEVDESGDEQLLRLYFTVLDSQGLAVPEAEVDSAVVVLDNGTRIEIDNPTRPDTPLYIVLVLDASGSMQQAAPAMRQAAIEAVNIAPPEALFSVIQFNQQINVIQGFSQDKNQVVNAIGTVNSVPDSGTCLYDATYSALELLGSLEPTARRAVIVFTDGRDEITLGRGDRCSTHTYDEVIALATDPTRPIPIHTIGLRGDRNINEQELRNTASATGGLSQIGTEASLSDLFTQIMNALRSQWLIEAPICIESGSHSATLTVTVGSTSLAPDAAQFEVTENCIPATPITPEPTPTPRPLLLFIESFRFDPVAEEISFEIRREGDGAIAQYRIQIINADSNQVIEQFNVDAVDGQITAVARSAENLPDGDIKIKVDAIDPNNIILIPADEAEDEFAIARPTPTPTATQLPVRLEIEGVEYDRENDVILLNLDLQNENNITDFEVRIFEQDTGLRIGIYEPELAEQIQLPTDGLEPGSKYRVEITAEGNNGERLAPDSSEFTYDLILTPTPTIQPTQQPEAEIQAVTQSEDKSELILTINTQNETAIKKYLIQFTNKETSLVVQSFTFNVPPYNEIRLPGDALPRGNYIVSLIAQDENGNQLSKKELTLDNYAPPPKPTATPSPGPVEQVTDAARDNPIIVLAILLIALVLVALFIWLIRSRRSHADESWAPLPASGKTMVDMKMPAQTGDNDATEILIKAPAISAGLYVMQTPDESFRKNWTVTKTPYKIGRQNADLTLPHDKGISRHHATILFENGQFFIMDEGSSNGTMLNGQPVPPKQRMALSNNTVISVGQNTRLRFETEEDDNATQVYIMPGK